MINGVIYKTTNNINGKIYVGRNETNNSKYLGSGKYFISALNKYGRENFIHTIIDTANNKQELCKKEIFWIKFYDSRNPSIGYNIGPGGEGAGSGEDHHFYGKFGKNHPTFGRLHSDEEKRKMKENHPDFSGENNPNYGKVTPEETKQKIKGSLVGRKLSEETKNKIGITSAGENNPMYGKTGEDSPNYGKHHSEETKEKMRIARKEYWKNIITRRI